MNGKDDQTEPHEPPETGDLGTQASLDRGKNVCNLDEDGIPILDEVIHPGDGYTVDFEMPLPGPSDAPGAEQTRHRLVLPDHQTVLTALRRSLKEQLNAELAEVIRETARSAAKQTSRDLKQLIQDQLTQSLEIRLNTLIEQALDQHFGDADS